MEKENYFPIKLDPLQGSKIDINTTNQQYNYVEDTKENILSFQNCEESICLNDGLL